MKILIAGFGSIGRRHLRNLRALGYEDILFYRTRRSTLPDDEIAGLPVETSIQAALAHKPDAVIITNPTALHMDVALPAAEAGCHILMEKPIFHSMERMDEFKAALQHGGGQFASAFQFRFNPGLQKTAELIKAGAFGRVLSARAHWGEYLPAWHPWEDYRASYPARRDLGGGVIMTLCHPLDYLRWLLGEVNELSAFTASNSGLELEVEDTAEINLHFCSGALANVHLDFVQRPATHHLEIIGTEGTLYWDNTDSQVKVFYAADQRWENFQAPAGFERNVMFMDELTHFLAVCQGQTQPLCPLEDGERALQIILAAYRSAQNGQVIKL
jgi:predicted dehydrogenase